MGFRSWRALLLLIAVSGCLGTGGPNSAAVPTASASEAPRPAPEATLTVTEGAIRGVVVSDELFPLQGVNVSLEKQALFAASDEAGAFTFNLLPPGTYTVVVQVTGYTSAAKRVDVLVGTVSWANFTLSPIASNAFYVDVFPQTALIELGQFQLENSVLRSAGLACQNCKHVFELGDNYRQFKGEYAFAPSPDYPATEEVLCYHLYRNTTSDAPNTVADEFIDTQCIRPGGGVTYATPTTLFVPTDQITWYVTPDRLPSYQQRLDIWFSISHNGDLPEGYSALPPPV